MVTIFGKVWDSSHIITENVMLLVSGIPEELIGKSGYFLIQENIGVKILIKFVEWKV